MGEPVRIVDLARDMIRLAGADEQDIRIEYTGLRPGEKLHEALFTDEEKLSATSFEQIMVAQQPPEPEEAFRAGVDKLLAAAERRDYARDRPSVEGIGARLPVQGYGRGLSDPVRLR